MAYDIRIVDTWGKSSGLDANIGFDSRVQSQSKTWKTLRSDYNTNCNERASRLTKIRI